MLRNPIYLWDERGVNINLWGLVNSHSSDRLLAGPCGACCVPRLLNQGVGRHSEFPHQSPSRFSSHPNEGLPPKRKKKLPQNKPSRDESSLPRCNISSMARSAAHGCFVNGHGLRRKNNNKKTRTTQPRPKSTYCTAGEPVSYTHLTLPTNREV